MTFGLKSLLAGTGLTGVLVYLLTAAPGMVSSLALIALWVALAALLASGIVHGRGRARAFCLGAMFPAGATIVALTWLLLVWLVGNEPDQRAWQQVVEFLDHSLAIRVWTVIGGVLVIAAGAAGVGGRSMFRSRQVEKAADAARGRLAVAEPGPREDVAQHGPARTSA